MYENVWKCRIPPKKVGKNRSILIIPVATPMSSTPRRWTISSASAGGGDDGGFHHVKLGLHQDNGRYLAYLGEIDWPNAFHLQCWRVSSELGTVYGWVCRINEILVGLKSRGYSSVGGWNPFLPGIMTILRRPAPMHQTQVLYFHLGLTVLTNALSGHGKNKEPNSNCDMGS